MPPAVYDACVAAIGREHVITDRDVTASYSTDWSGRYSGPVLGVLRPGSTQKAADVVRICVEARIPILPQGGNTGLVGGSVPGPHDQPMMVISTRRLDSLGPVDELTGQVTVGAGATLAAVHAHANAAGWNYGVDLASRDSCTIGGNIGTNAGGIRVCCYGMTRRQVVGLEVVLPDGQIVSNLSGLIKDNTGYNFPSLFTGSEGTLGLVTAARLALVRPPRASAVALIGVESAAHALSIVNTAVPAGSRLLAAEILDDPLLELIARGARLPMPLGSRPPHLLLLETESSAPGEVSMDLPDDLDVVVATDASSKARFWRYRELAGETVGHLGLTHRFDVSVPRHRWDEFSAAVRVEVMKLPDVQHYFSFGHLADGNLHLEVIGPAADDDRSDATVLKIVAEFGGSISAEHGVGRQKATYLHLSRSSAEIAAMRALKSALDPHWLFNPGALLTVQEG
jgi:FAD/FMN-containing dehydrogenase